MIENDSERRNEMKYNEPTCYDCEYRDNDDICALSGYEIDAEDICPSFEYAHIVASYDEEMESKC